MRIYYVAHSRIPTEKAHGLTIVKSCAAFAHAGEEVTLILPRRKTQFTADIFSTYSVEKNFTVRFLPTLDLLRLSASRWAFWGSYLTFYISALVTLLFLPKKDAVIYTREAPLLTLALFGMRVVLEAHTIPKFHSLYFWLARKASRIIVISGALKDAFIAAGFSEDKVLVAPSGVDLSIFSTHISQTEARTKLSLPLEKKILVYTGNFTTMGEDKGISDILHALKNLPDVLFVAVGGSDKDKARYHNEAQSLGVETQTRFEGFAPQQTLALYSSAADIVLMPFPDTPHYRKHMSPVKMFEYMASGRPIVATSLPTITEVLDKGNAVLVTPNNPTALAGAIQRLLEDPTYAGGLATQATKDVQNYSWKKRSERILAYIEK